MRSPNVLRKDPYFRFHLIEQDPDDNKFVDCAIVAGADYIVSEDAHFRVLSTIPFPKVNVILLDDFLKDATIYFIVPSIVYNYGLHQSQQAYLTDTL